MKTYKTGLGVVAMFALASKGLRALEDHKIIRLDSFREKTKSQMDKVVGNLVDWVLEANPKPVDKDVRKEIVSVTHGLVDSVRKSVSTFLDANEVAHDLMPRTFTDVRDFRKKVAKLLVNMAEGRLKQGASAVKEAASSAKDELKSEARVIAGAQAKTPGKATEKVKGKSGSHKHKSDRRSARTAS